MSENRAPMISVIVPVYNAEKQIERCVKSIQAQTVEQIEIILVNDGSKDQSLSVCKALAQADDRITVISKENEGAGAARNAGMAVAKGQLIYFADADDWIEPDLLESLVNGIDLEDEGTMAICARFCEDDNGRQQSVWLPVVEGREWHSEDIADCIANLEESNVFNYLWDRVYFRSVIEKYKICFDNQFVTGEDLDFNFQYFLHVTKCTVILRPLYHYVSVTVNPDSLCARFKPRMYEVVSELCIRRQRMHQTMGMTGSERYEMILAKRCAEHLHTVVANMYRDNSPLSAKDRREVFEKLMNNEKLCTYLRQVAWKSPLMKIFRRAILRKNVWLAEREYAVLFFARHRMRKLYGLVQKRS